MPVSKGTCTLCKGSFSKQDIVGHLESCLKLNLIGKKSGDEPAAPRKFLHLLVEGRDLDQYWMHLKVPSHCRLEDLDRFLGDT